MSHDELIRAWRDPDFRDTLDEQQLRALPDHPAGPGPAESAEAEMVSGGSTEHFATLGCCNGFTTDEGVCSLYCGGGPPYSSNYTCSTYCGSHSFCCI